MEALGLKLTAVAAAEADPVEHARPLALAVNAAIEVAAQPWAAQVRVIDTVDVFTPGEHYREAMEVGGQSTIVRESDGIHLNDAGAGVAADVVLDRVDDDFSF